MYRHDQDPSWRDGVGIAPEEWERGRDRSLQPDQLRPN